MPRVYNQRHTVIRLFRHGAMNVPFPVVAVPWHFRLWEVATRPRPHGGSSPINHMEVQTHMRFRTAAVTAILSVAALIGGAATSASAHDPAGTANDPKLVKFTSDPVNGSPTALIAFKSVAGGDAPGSKQPKALRVETDDNPPAGPYSYAGATVKNTSIDGQAVADISRLSFKTKGSFSGGGGSPRLSMYLSDGTVAFLASDRCSTALNPGPWRKANFLASFASNPVCNIDTYSGSYASDAVSSAWDKFVAAEGAKTVTGLELVVDEGPSVQWVDDIRVNGLVFAGPNVNTHSH